ncbi:hypothetical protein [Bryobacter aggregatus]|uniref:hypothetical protein n=1 Tax=Bryobacter aggregatus TaxID=360054 RepID=UPI00068E1AC2|nr:hypothetical protein [Bryobacter aggregatus]
MIRILIPLFLSALAMLGADGNPAITGNWKGSAEGPNGAIERSFTLKVEGSKLSGETVSQYTGKSTLNEGKADGDTITFSINAKIQDNEMKLNYKGKMTGKDQIKLSSEGFGGSSIEWTLKRVQ